MASDTEQSPTEQRLNVEFCLLCGRENRLQQHHLSYYPNQTMTVCKHCHDRIHNKDGWNDHLKPDDKPHLDESGNWKLRKYGGEEYAPDHIKD